MAKATSKAAVEVNSEVEQLKALVAQLLQQNQQLSQTVKVEASKGSFTRKSFPPKSKHEYSLATECGGKYNGSTYEVDFDDEASYLKFKAAITTKRNNSKQMLKNADLSAYKWIKKSEDGEFFSVFAANPEKNFLGNPARFLLSSLFTFKIKLSADGWHQLPASVFQEFWSNFSQVFIYTNGNYDPASKKDKKGSAADTADF